MKRLAKNIAGFLKGYSGCSHCSDSWSWKKTFDIPLDIGKGCFPICVECAAVLSVDEILAYIDELDGGVTKEQRDHAEKWLREREAKVPQMNCPRCKLDDCPAPSEIYPQGGQGDQCLEHLRTSLAEAEANLKRVGYLGMDMEIAKLEHKLLDAEKRATEAELTLQKLKGEISCRVEHGADSNGHLEGLQSLYGEKKVKTPELPPTFKCGRCGCLVLRGTMCGECFS